MATELLAFPKVTSHECMLLEGWIQENVFVVTIDTSLAFQAAQVRRLYRLKTADAIIAATALRLHVPLMSRDKDFMRVPGLEIIH